MVFAAVLTYTLSCCSRLSSSNALPQRRSSSSFLLTLLSSHHQQTLHKHFTFLASHVFFPSFPSPLVAIAPISAPFCLQRVIRLGSRSVPARGRRRVKPNSIQSCNATFLPTGRVPGQSSCSLQTGRTSVLSAATSSNGSNELILTLF